MPSRGRRGWEREHGGDLPARRAAGPVPRQSNADRRLRSSTIALRSVKNT
ncbi:hypothetical protein SGM_3390 [Streptomyces griseoaurantiacus M045]|uniref:Uncharacterized protein n=1 Tax=Streptomyces griseoaurantiacus M045 TaxID=996637 RepID=F3NJS6_9ACTN|nr:hypothetical protein SGM_3390 [Streptomyces griseoaurantiacus M045]